MKQVNIDTYWQFGNTKLADAAKMYRSYINDFLTVEVWAEHYQINSHDSTSILALCKAAHEAGF